MRRTHMSASRSLLAIALSAALVAAAACLDSVTATRPLGVTISASPTSVLVGDTVQFDVTGQGTNVVAIIVAFGDGAADTLTYPAAVEVIDITKHAYDAPGSYEAVGTVLASNGQLSDQVVVTVN